MPPNLRKPQPNLSKPSEGGSFNAKRKPSEETTPLRGLNLTGERELGSVGGIKATGRLTVGVGDLIGQQGVNVEIDATNRTAGFGVGIGSTKGKLGVNIGGKIGYDEEGRISIKGAEASINIGGFGGGASIDEDEGIRGSISVAGAKVEVGIAPDGKKNLSLCYGVPGGELCVTFEPQPNLPSAPAPAENNKGLGSSPEELTPLLSNGSCYDMAILLHSHNTTDFIWEGEEVNIFVRPSAADEGHGGGVWINNASAWYASIIYKGYTRSPAFIEEHIPAKSMSPSWTGDVKGNFKAWAWVNYSPQIIIPNGIQYYEGLTPPWRITGSGAEIKKYIRDWQGSQIWDISVFEIPCSSTDTNPDLPRRVVPKSSSNGGGASPSITLPNYPQHFKPMNDCCEQVKEIYRYLGIAKLKKNKFPVSNAFLVPGGNGNDNCVDYYSIMQALFRMLANGLILNPKSKPLGSEYQNANATAWASAMYEMAAESMSDGNSTQRFEVAAIMQLVQIMATLAENGRKIEFVADQIGIEPLLVSEKVPVCFTVYEGHKGFGKKEPKKINVSNLKTDKNVEDALGEMLSPSQVPITAWKFKPGQISINEALRNG